MKVTGKIFLFLQTTALLAVVSLFSCTGSIQKVRVDDRLEDYRRSSLDYHQSEQEYLELLFNLERYPGDAYLLQQKKVKMQELITLRNIMLQSRSELDEAIQIWEMDLRKERAEALGKPPEPEYLYVPEDYKKSNEPLTLPPKNAPKVPLENLP